MDREQFTGRVWYQIESRPRDRIWLSIECKAAERVIDQAALAVRNHFRNQLLASIRLRENVSVQEIRAQAKEEHDERRAD